MRSAESARTGAPPREVALLLNPHAFGVRPDDADRLSGLCRDAGITVVEAAHPESPREMAAAARRYAGKVEGLLVVGGDGALNSALPGCLGTDTAIGMLPRGTVNVWAREIGLPAQPDRAIKALAGGRTRAIDVGRIDWPEAGATAHFLLMAGLGFDGEVTRLVDRRLKRFVGIGAYVLASVAAYFRHEPYRATIEVDGVARSLDLTQLVVANARHYGGDLPLAASAELADGWLDLWTLGPAPKWQHAARFARIVTVRSDPGDRLLPVRARRVRVTAPHQVAAQIDGDPAPDYPGPIEVSVLPGALRAWLPRR
jgi:diacylglycerol kinase family enzyme